MKKTVLILGISILIGSCHIKTEQEYLKDEKDSCPTCNYEFYTFMHDGHQYLAKDFIVDTYGPMTITNFTHDGNCPCMKK